MKLAIMQPYFFPYIGYFQLINAADAFVIYDDVQYMKGGWINRNKILSNKKKESWITLPVSRENFHLKINERYFADSFNDDKYNLIRKLDDAYRGAPYFKAVVDLIRVIFNCNERNISLFMTNQLKTICNYIGINTPFHVSSTLDKNNDLKGQERVIELVKVLGADYYINPFGGLELYSKKEFNSHGITLSFLKSKDVKYAQFGIEFIPNLSIIDVLMFNSITEINKLMGEYELI